MSKFVCTVCGYVYEGEAAPEFCPVCKAPASKFVEQKGEMTWAAEHVVGVAKGVDPEIIEGLRMNFNGECSEVGTMIETPAAVLVADDLAQECDFFSIGTNDLTQYTCALDRQNAKLEPFFDPHHPAVLKAIRMTIEAGHRHGIWVGICGELGADTALTETFLRMGVDELSMNAKSILPVRKIIRGVDLSKPSAKNV